MYVLDGQFAVPKPQSVLPFTGERLTTEMQGQIEYEHLHRYCLARDFCGDLDIADVASGEGYGSAILAGVARSVVGVEIDAATVEHARANYEQPNLRFLVGNALALPLDDASVDVVVSFETLEHVANHDQFLSEVRRVLRTGGLFVVSTPDRLVYSAPQREPNPYHLHELTGDELAKLLGRHFAKFDLLQQRPVLGSVIASSTTPGWRSFDRRSSAFIEASSGLARADYLIAVASDEAIPELGSSIYLDWRRVHDVVTSALRLPSVTAELEQLRAEADAKLAQLRAKAEAEHAQLRAEADAERQRMTEARNQDVQHRDHLFAEESRLREALRRDFEHLQQERNQIEQQLRAAEQARAEAYAARERVETSAIWRATAPARVLGARVPRLSRNIRRLIQLVWWTLTLQLGYRLMLWRRHRANLNAARQVEAAPKPQPSIAAETVQPADPPPSPKPDLPVPKPDLLAAFQMMHGRTAIFFPPVSAPEVSVIVPAYRSLDDVMTCLRSLALHRVTEPSFEVLLVDDCPEEQVHWAVPNSGGLIKLVNEENLGFLRSCNRAAAQARGRVLCFLNSDTIVQSGWLRSLVEVVDSSPRVGLVGGMLLNRDGTIQDAGWRILADGWGYPLGRGADAGDGAHTYRRQVDCVTGACFAIRREVWQELEGFDEAYVPAFYEEFDLAFRARSRGLEIIYEPRSRVVHLGSNSYGPERRNQLSSINQRTFAARFAEEMRLQPTDVADEFALRSVRPERPVILVVDYGVPQPDRHAGDVTMASYLSILVDAGWRVIFGPRDGQAEGPHAEALENIGIEFIRAPQTIQGWLARYGTHVKQVWLSRPEIAEALIGPIRTATKATVAYYTHDLHHLRLTRQAELTSDPAVAAEAERVRMQETAVLRNVDHVMTPSVEEGDLIRRLAPETPVTILPPYTYDASAVRSRDAASFAGLRDVVFVGGFPHTPNVDAALFIVREVMPLVWQKEPDARLLLVGYAPPREVLDLAGPRVVVTGQVPDIAPYLNCARVMLAALRYGAGVKGKVVEALRSGVPVVTTSVGAEGIGLRAGTDAIVAESPAGLANGVIALLRDADRCEALSKAGAALVSAHFSRAAARGALERVFHLPRCRVCGSVRLGVSTPDFGQREGFACHDCYALGRAEVLAGLLVRRIARDGETTLAEVFRRRRDIRIHEFGFVGGIARTLRGLPNYSESEFFPDVPVGTVGPGGIRCEDLTHLTFADESFDAVLSQDVMEHVPDPVRAFAETARVLRPGGSHFFTVPQDNDLERSVTRAVLRDGVVEHLLPPVYHGDPVRSEGALVFTDYGRDLAELVAQAGLLLVEHESVVPSASESQKLRVFEALKLAAPLPDLMRDDAELMFDLQDRDQAFETLIRACYAAELKEGDVAVDGGANFGLHSKPLTALVGPRGRVHAFEPLPHAATSLRHAYGSLPQFLLHEQALGAQPGRSTFHHVVNEDALSSLLKRDLSFAYPGLQIREIDVEVVTLDSLADEPVRFIKLDLEGYDFLALKGGKRLLTEQSPVLVFECGRADAAVSADYGSDEFFTFFEELGYVLLDLFGRPFGRAEFQLPWDSREVPHYVVAVKAHKTEELATALRRRTWSILIAADHMPSGLTLWCSNKQVN